MRIAWLLSILVVLAPVAGGSKVSADDTRPANLAPFDGATHINSISTTNTSTQPEPSMLSKVVSAPKNLATKVGNTLTGKKTVQKQPINPYTSAAKPKLVSPQPPAQNKSWFGSLFQSKTPPPEPNKKMPIADWVGQKRVAW